MREIIPLVSFPKSGNTWMRFLLANIFKRDENEEINFTNINEFSPTSINQDIAAFSCKSIDNAPIFIKEHANYNDMEEYEYSKAIYIYRNGLDTLKSYWHFTDAQSPGLYKNIDQFSKYYWAYCGHWGDHIESWLFNSAQKKKLKVLPVKYEDLRNNTFTVMERILTFLNLEIEPEIIKKAIENSDSKKMKNMDGSQDFMKSKRKNFHFVRNAKSGEAAETLPYNIVFRFLKYRPNFKIMQKFNYNIPIEIKNTQFKDKFEFENKIFLKLLLYKYKLISLISIKSVK